MTDSGAGTVSASDPARWVGRYDFIDVARDGRTQTIVASELSYYPFTYVLAIGAPLPVDALAEITDFTLRQRGEVFDDTLTLPVNRSFLPFDIP